jgi:hypothetical protein
MSRSNVITVCGWCPQLHILQFDRQPDDLVMIQQHGRQLTVSRNGALMVVSHGICEPCRRKELAQGAIKNPRSSEVQL